MTLPPTIPIIFLILGALAVGASDLARLRRPSLVMVIASALALVAVVALRPATPITQIVSDWQPVSVFGAPISFRVDQTAWIIAVGFVVACLATALTWLAYPGQHRPAPRALSLLLIAAALASVFASNLLTLAIAWGLLDIVFAGTLLVRRGPQVGRRAALAIMLNTSATICVWIATLLIENEHGSLYWHLLSPSEAARAWLIAAAVLRVGLYPLHQQLPIELGHEPDRAVLLFAVPTTIGLALWSRLAIAQALPTESIVPILAVLSALVGSVLAWSSSQARAGLPFIALSLSGFALINVTAGAEASTFTAVTLNWLFVIVGLFIARGFDRQTPWWSIGALIAGLSIVGVPGTLGFVVQMPAIIGSMAADRWWMLAGILIAQTLLVAAMIRLIFSPVSNDERPIDPLRQVSFALAMACAALPLIVFALTPALVPDVRSIQQVLGDVTAATGLIWALPVAIGITLALRDRRADMATPEALPPAWTNALRLEWLNAIMAFFVQRMTAFLRGLGSVFEGEGGLIWVMILVIVGLVLTSGALK